MDPEQDTDAAELRRRLERFDWSFAKDEDIAYAEYFGSEGTWLVLPRAMLNEMADTRTAVTRAKTWGDLRRTLPDRRLAEVVEASYVLEDEPYEGKTLEDIPDDAEFTGAGYDYDQFPDYPDKAMLDWLPWEILSEFGSEESTMVSHWYVIYEIDALLEGLRSVGATCEMDEGLFSDAFNGR